MNDTEWSLTKQRIAELLDLDLDAYKESQMRRRLENLIQRRQSGDVKAYFARVKADAESFAELRDLVTINVSEFFRNPLQFEALKSVVFPALLKESPRLSIWSAGCSFGPEPYSFAMILDELEGIRAGNHRILATDLDQEVLKRAMNGGPYTADEVRGIAPERLSKYFQKTGDRYQVKETLRRRITFRRQNLLKDRFDKGFDLISCRNVTIYFSSETKVELYGKFHDSLKPNGVFFIGGTEALLGAEANGWGRYQGNFYRRAERTQERRVA